MGDKKKRQKESRVSRFFVYLFLGANIMTLALLWACCASTWVDTSLHPRVSVIGLAFPFFLLANLLFVPFWLLFKPRMLVVPLLGISLCGDYILDYFPLHLGGNRPSSADTLKVLTWNIHNPLNYNKEMVEPAMTYLQESGADIICLQEFNGQAKGYAPLLQTMKERGYYVQEVNRRFVLSRFPILSQVDIRGESYATNGATLCRIQMGDDTLHLFNVHLECNRLTDEDKDEYSEALHTSDRGKVKDGILILSGKLSAAARYRATQVHAITSRLDSLQGRPVLLCGDFNDTPISYTYQQVGRRLKNAYREGGSGVGVTYSERLFPVRIDHIFHSGQWQCIDAHVDVSIEASDHYPVIARFEKRQK